MVSDGSDVEKAIAAKFDEVVANSPNIERVTDGEIIYLQRTGERLVRSGDLPDVLNSLDNLRIPVLNRAEALDAETETFPAPDIELVRFEPGRGDITTVLRDITEDLRRNRSAAEFLPHYVFVGAGNIMGHPDKPPVRTSRPSTINDVPSPNALFGDHLRVGICDTGICLPGVHDDIFAGRYPDSDAVHDPIYATGSSDELRLESAHGTFIAGVLAQVAPGAVFVPDIALDDDGIGDEFSVATSLRRLYGLGVRIFNLSLGAPALTEPAGLAAAIQALPGDAVVLAAAGNTGTDALHYPAALPGVIAVGATEIVDGNVVVAPYSNTGPWIKIWAPGTATSTFVKGTLTLRGMPPLVYDVPWASWSGTSFSTPYAAGWIAGQAAARGVPPRQVVGDLLINPPATLVGAALLA